MNRFLKLAAAVAYFAVCVSAPAAAQAVPSIKQVQVLQTRGQVEIEIEASDHLVPQTNLLSRPDRLVVDFVNAVPGARLRNQMVNRDEVKSLRVGLFSSNPPVTRIVVDLTGPQPYQVFPSGRTVIVKIGAGTGEGMVGYRSGSGPTLTTTDYSSSGAHLSVDLPPPPRPALAVSFDNGLLSVFANKASLSEVLFAIHQRTGADIAIPAGAEQEPVVAELGPAPAPEILTRLLNGSKFNFLILSSSSDPRVLDRVILSSRPEGPMPPPPRPQPRVQVEEQDADVEPKAAPVPRPAPSRPAQNPNSTDQQDQGQGQGQSDGSATPTNPAPPNAPAAKPQPGDSDIPD